MGTKSVHKLSSTPENSFVILGIASHENDYRISWALNTNLGYKFTKSENHKVFNKKINEVQEFSTYLSVDNDRGCVFKLISNRCDNGFLFEELRTLDYFLVIENADNIQNTEAVVHDLKSVPFISTAFLLNPANIKGINRIK